jgi:hypothetical protein
MRFGLSRKPRPVETEFIMSVLLAMNHAPKCVQRLRIETGRYCRHHSFCCYSTISWAIAGSCGDAHSSGFIHLINKKFMINKRLLSKKPSSTMTNSFYDKSAKYNPKNSKFLKHVCAPANSNPKIIPLSLLRMRTIKIVSRS